MTERAYDSGRLRRVVDSPVEGLAVFERRVDHVVASLVAVHGALDRAASFARLTRRLDQFNVVAYDRRGYQSSRDLGPGTLDDHVADLAAVVTRVGQATPVILFGHSFGGVVTFAYASRRGHAQLLVNYETPLPWILARPALREPGLIDDEVERFFRQVMSDAAWERLDETQRESRRRDAAALRSDLAIVEGAMPFDLSTLSVESIYAHGDGPSASYYRSLVPALRRTNPAIEAVELLHSSHDAHLRASDRLAQLLTGAARRLSEASVAPPPIVHGPETPSHTVKNSQMTKIWPN